MAASLPDCTISPFTKSLTNTGLPFSKNIREPSAFHALSEAVSIWSGFNFPSSNALNVKYAVINLVKEAGSIC